MMHVERIDPRREPERALATWRALADDTRSPFLATPWVETWIELLPPRALPSLYVLHDACGPRLAMFLGARRVLRGGVLPSRALYLHATGVPAFDELCVEHNGVVGSAPPGLAPSSLLALVEQPWDEVVLPGLDADEFPARELLAHEPSLIVDHDVPSPFVDLASVRAHGYPSVLAPRVRAELGRARRGWAARGPITVEVAQDLASARDIYDELVALHGARWRRRGQPGAFANRFFDRFQRRHIERAGGVGEVALLRVRAGAATVGCLYLLVRAGRVLYYQSGFSDEADARLKPGFVCHAAAVEWCAARGDERYDFLGGNGRYKRSLSTGATRLVWLRLRRPRARFWIEARLRRLRDAWRELASPLGEGGTEAAPEG